MQEEIIDAGEYCAIVYKKTKDRFKRIRNDIPERKFELETIMKQQFGGQKGPNPHKSWARWAYPLVKIIEYFNHIKQDVFPR